MRKRQKGLLPLSRDHGLALVCAQECRKAVRATAFDRIRLTDKIRETVSKVILIYLEDEKRVLSPVIQNDKLKRQFHCRQNDIRKLTYELGLLDAAVDPGLSVVSRIANALDEYVRWEENFLFPEIEGALDDAQAESLADATSLIEAHRMRPTRLLHASIAF